MENEKNIEFISAKAEEKELKKNPFKEFLTGSILVRENIAKQFPFLFFLVGLGLLYIGNRYHAEKVYRETLSIQNELAELRAEAVSCASELMFLSKQSEVLQLMDEYGLDLKESLIPPYKLNLD